MRLFLLVPPLLLATSGCLRDSGVVKPVDAAVLEAYKNEQRACVNDAGTLEQADECTDAVKAKYGRK